MEYIVRRLSSATQVCSPAQHFHVSSPTFFPPFFLPSSILQFPILPPAPRLSLPRKTILVSFGGGREGSLEGEYSKYSSWKHRWPVDEKERRVAAAALLSVICEETLQSSKIIEDRLASCGQSSLQHQIKTSAHRLIMVTLRAL